MLITYSAQRTHQGQNLSPRKTLKEAPLFILKKVKKKIEHLTNGA